MKRLIVAPRAQRDIELLLARSLEQFGEAASQRYRALIGAALHDLIDDGDRPAARTDKRLPSGVRLYHLRHANRRTPVTDRVGQPRHFLVFRSSDEIVEVVRVLHESMDLASQSLDS